MTREQEAAIVRKVLGGDANAFETLVLEYEKNVYNIALRMTGNSEDAADMTQEAFIKAYNSLQSFRGDSKFSVWLYRIVSNVCLDFLRSKNRRPTVSLSVEDDDGEDAQLDVADESQSPELLLDRKLVTGTCHFANRSSVSVCKLSCNRIRNGCIDDRDVVLSADAVCALGARCCDRADEIHLLSGEVCADLCC